MDDAVPFQMCTLSGYFTNPALSYFTIFSLHYFTNFSKLERTPQNKHIPLNPNQQAYPIQKALSEELQELVLQWLADKTSIKFTYTNKFRGRQESKQKVWG